MDWKINFDGLIWKFYILVKLVFFSNFKQSRIIQALVNEYLVKFIDSDKMFFVV